MDFLAPGPRSHAHRDRTALGVLLTVTLVAQGCGREPVRLEDPAPAGTTAIAPRPNVTQPPAEEPMHAERRERMVRTQIVSRGVRSPLVLDAMRAVPRHRFVPEELVDEAYADTPLPIGHRQTISQPYIVALMTELVRPTKDKRALDVGTGSGYQAAVLAEIVDHVDSIDIVCPLAEQARERLTGLGYDNVTIRCGDGWAGWPGGGPYDIIVVAAAPEEIPPPLLAQLAVGGRLVIPVGVGDQELILVEKGADGALERRYITAVRFVPMTGRAQDGDPERE